MTTTRGGASEWRARAWRYGPVLVWVGVIFFASTGNLSASNTSRIVRPLLLWLFPAITEAELLRAHFFVRKAAHFTEYAVLALLAARALLTSSRPALKTYWPAFALALVAAVALLDEYNQSLTATRTGTIYDSLIDITGGVFAVCVVWAWRCRRARRRRQERLTLS
ncbi:MAG TPA: VanZ family protein [Pyrinomonadaceae bacterium]|nr:VanZ family protein [Pyrinomonadaceae bacterium]